MADAPSTTASSKPDDTGVPAPVDSSAGPQAAPAAQKRSPVVRGLLATVKHPFLHLILLVAFCLEIEEYYPFSHFPMYSDPDESENYLVVAKVKDNGEFEPLPIQTLTGITAPKVKKMYKSRLDEYVDKVDKSHHDLTAEEEAAIGRELLDYLRTQALARSNGQTPLPQPLVLLDYWIEYTKGGGFSETPEVIVREDAAGAPAETSQASSLSGAAAD